MYVCVTFSTDLDQDKVYVCRYYVCTYLLSFTDLLALSHLRVRFIRSNLPQSMQDVMPMYQDGFDLWNAHEEYVEEYLDIFYPSEQSIQSGAQH